MRFVNFNQTNSAIYQLTVARRYDKFKVTLNNKRCKEGISLNNAIYSYRIVDCYYNNTYIQHILLFNRIIC